MKAPRYATITLSLDTERFRLRRPEERERIIGYLLNRLLAGESVADGALETYEIRATVREALGAEIIKRR